jgi:hypothetical protein
MSDQNNLMLRRDFLRLAVIAALPGIFGCSKPITTGNGSLSSSGDPDPSTPPPLSNFVPKTRARGPTVVDVKSEGALGNGTHDDTAAIQKAIDSLPADGGTVFIPAGTYMIDALKSVNLRSLMLLKLDPQAKLVAITNSSDQYRIVSADKLHDVEIAGGELFGERTTHKGTTGEGGHCLTIKGSERVTVRDIKLTNGWGDGISIGPVAVFQGNFIVCKDVEINNVICFNNRRNGLSITNVLGIKVFNSQFLNTNGTKPQCGIDVEPNADFDDSGSCDQVWIESCLMSGNEKYGLNVWNRSHNLTITKCYIEKNKSCGMVTRGVTGLTLTDNSINNNMATGLFLQIETVDADVNGNTFFRNYLMQTPVSRSPFCMTDVSSKIQKDIIIGSGTTNINVGSNCYK